MPGELSSDAAKSLSVTNKKHRRVLKSYSFVLVHPVHSGHALDSSCSDFMVRSVTCPGS